MSAKCINEAWGRPGGKGSRSVANFDEDSITMGVSSALMCMKTAAFSPDNISGLYFATTTPPYKEKSSAVVIGTALDLRSEIRTVDYGASLRASTAALLGAMDTVCNQQSGDIMVTASDCRLGEPGSMLEVALGDASAALIVGNKNTIADVIDTYSVCDDILDQWRRDEDPYVRDDDVRFAQIYGFQKAVSSAINGILRKTGLKKTDFAKVVILPIDSRSHIKLASKLGFDVKSQLVPMVEDVGLCGVAQPFLLLSIALEKAQPGEKILVTSYGDGADAIVFEVTEGINGLKDRGRIKKEQQAWRELTSYNKYLSFNNLIKGQEPLTQPFSSTTLVYREKYSNVRLYARKCEKCGKVVFLRDIHVCPGCYAQDQFSLIKLSKEATLFTFNQE
ncbi:MAG: 3-hydroxy-3-methylglutaryl CoA synthase, partial [Deltaproteobacteria bacterium]|nr:3-hydroxy-3-methylglutaryl CoA synthase [Deltaproteobacteria bacterium]